jgi:type VI secretion system secreted protein VgrG
MPLNVTVSFPSSADASAVVAAGLKVRRYELREAASELFELTLEVLSTDPAIAERAIAGQAAVVGLGDEPFVTQVSGIVRQVEQRTAVLSGDSLYAWTVVPPLWLTTRRRDHRIFQDMSVPAIVAAVLAGPSYGGRIPAPATLLGDHPPREYVVQYAETDWEFLSRILAGEGIASFFDHANGSAWTLIDERRIAVCTCGVPGSFMRLGSRNGIAPLVMSGAEAAVCLSYRAPLGTHGTGTGQGHE